MSVLVALLLGLLAGVSSGLLGIGGGILFVPALAIFLDQTQIQAEATSLLAIVPVAVVGAWRQASYGNVRLRDGVLIGVLSPLGVLVGAVVANELSDRALEVAFACLILFVAYRLVVRAFSVPETPPPSARGTHERGIDTD